MSPRQDRHERRRGGDEIKRVQEGEKEMKRNTTIGQGQRGEQRKKGNEKIDKETREEMRGEEKATFSLKLWQS